MTTSLDFVSTAFNPVPAGTTSVTLTIQSTFPTIANAGVKMFKDNGDGTGSQVSQGVVIDTSANTAQTDNAVLSLDGSGRYAIAFQGQASALDTTGVDVGFVLTANGAVIDALGGARHSADLSVFINGTALFQLP